MKKLSPRTVSATLIAVLALLGPVVVRASEGGVVALTPRPNEHVTQPPKVIALRIAARASLAQSAVRLIVDGRDVSDAITTRGNVVEYKPATALSGGEHAVEVSVTDAAGGRLSYSWTFTVAGAPKQATTASSSEAPQGSASAQAAPSSQDTSTLPSDGSQTTGAGTTQEVYGQQNFYGGFYPIGGGPYYWGDNAAFEFEGIPGGFGFLTFSGIPGVFDLVPLGLSTFYAIVPIPIGFVFVNPFVTCHFFTPGGSSTVAVVPSFPIVRHRRGVDTGLLHGAEAGRSSTLPRSTESRSRSTHLAPAEHALPLHFAPHGHAFRFEPTFWHVGLQRSSRAGSSGLHGMVRVR